MRLDPTRHVADQRRIDMAGRAVFGQVALAFTGDAEMVERVQADPILVAHGHLWIDDQYIPRDRWRVVRPKPGVTVTLRVVPHGGGGGGGKNPLRTVLTIAVIAAA